MKKNKGQNLKIDTLLKRIEKSGDYTFDSEDFVDNDNRTEYYRLINFMTEIKLLRQISEKKTYLVVTELGFDVLSKGGWIKYLNTTNFKKNVSLYKDLVLTIIPILSLITTIFIAFYVNNKKNINSNKVSIEVSRQLEEIKTDLDRIENRLNKTDSLGTK